MSDDGENGAAEDSSSDSFMLKVRLPTGTLDALREELSTLMEHALYGGQAHAFLSSVLRSLRAAEAVTRPERVPLRDRLRCGAEYAASQAAKLEAQGHPAASTLRRIGDTLDELLQCTDEEIRGRMAEVENLIRRLNEFSEG
jgi:hypothetical protein